jgi:hypothetical protein
VSEVLRLLLTWVILFVVLGLVVSFFGLIGVWELAGLVLVSLGLAVLLGGVRRTAAPRSPQAR